MKKINFGILSIFLVIIYGIIVFGFYIYITMCHSESCGFALLIPLEMFKSIPSYIFNILNIEGLEGDLWSVLVVVFVNSIILFLIGIIIQKIAKVRKIFYKLILSVFIILTIFSLSFYKDNTETPKLQKLNDDGTPREEEENKSGEIELPVI